MFCSPLIIWFFFIFNIKKPSIVLILIFSKYLEMISAAFTFLSGLLLQVRKIAAFFPSLFLALFIKVLTKGAGLPAQIGAPTNSMSYFFRSKLVFVIGKSFCLIAA